jgi:hypothetical protein
VGVEDRCREVRGGRNDSGKGQVWSGEWRTGVSRAWAVWEAVRWLARRGGGRW